MKKLVLLTIVSAFCSDAAGAMQTAVYKPNGQSISDHNDPIYLMVGTHVEIVVSSTEPNDDFPSDLVMREEDASYGELWGRDFNDVNGHYYGSVLEAADEGAYVYDALFFPSWIGLSYVGGGDVGDWWVADYNAVAIGDCNVAFFENLEFEPTYEYAFVHVRTRDFNSDTIVNFLDYSIFVDYWQADDCADPNWCEGSDLDTSGVVDGNDLRLFTGYWLEQTE